jgi:hypothetical protein
MYARLGRWIDDDDDDDRGKRNVWGHSPSTLVQYAQSHNPSALPPDSFSEAMDRILRTGS